MAGVIMQSESAQNAAAAAQNNKRIAAGKVLMSKGSSSNMGEAS